MMIIYTINLPSPYQTDGIPGQLAQWHNRGRADLRTRWCVAPAPP